METPQLKQQAADHLRTVFAESLDAWRELHAIWLEYQSPQGIDSDAFAEIQAAARPHAERMVRLDRDWAIWAAVGAADQLPEPAAVAVRALRDQLALLALAHDASTLDDLLSADEINQIVHVAPAQA